MINCLIILVMLLLAAPVGLADNVRDSGDTTSVWKQPVRRLHPERERAKAVKKLQEMMTRRAEEKDDPWDTSDEVWGTVDVPAAARDSSAVKGRRLSGSSDVDDAGYRMMWRDEPVTATVDQLMPYFTVTDSGELHSKYVSTDSASSEVYFAFVMNDSQPGPLRLCVLYPAEVPVEYDQLTFSIDGYDYMFYPVNPQCKALGGGHYLSFCDEVLHDGYKDLVYALAHGHWMMLKLQGVGGVSRVKVLTDGQREDFSQTLALYLLLGGEL